MTIILPPGRGPLRYRVWKWRVQRKVDRTKWRVAQRIKRALGRPYDTDFVSGVTGQRTVWIDGHKFTMLQVPFRPFTFSGETYTNGITLEQMGWHRVDGETHD